MTYIVKSTNGLTNFNDFNDALIFSAALHCTWSIWAKDKTSKKSQPAKLLAWSDKPE